MKGRREAELGHEGQILFMVNKIRKDHPCMSAREIYFKLNPQGMGRDKFEAFCFDNGLPGKEAEKLP